MVRQPCHTLLVCSGRCQDGSYLHFWRDRSATNEVREILAEAHEHTAEQGAYSLSSPLQDLMEDDPRVGQTRSWSFSKSLLCRQHQVTYLPQAQDSRALDSVPVTLS